MPVYTVRWNRLHPRTFLSCGADWALKVWDEARPAKVKTPEDDPQKSAFCLLHARSTSCALLA